MSERNSRKFKSGPAVHWAPWEKAFDRVLTPLEEFIKNQNTSSVLLMLCAVVALVIANSSMGGWYLGILHEHISLTVIHTEYSMSIVHWINDGLMTGFFLIMGLELKRELITGELANPRHALLPVLAALGGMVVPALIYVCINPAGIALKGWGIPMATDIAFAVGALSLLGDRVPRSAIIFLIALAIVDDLGAVLVIALFYTQKLNATALIVTALLSGILIALNLGGVRRLTPYLVVGFWLWCAMIGSGIHATLSGIILAFCIPIKPKYNTEHFLKRAAALIQHMKNRHGKVNEELFNSQLTTLERGVELVQAPAGRLEHLLHIYVAYLVIPIFALANAAIPVDFKNIATQVVNPITLGIIGGLVVGKFVGIAGVTWLAVKSGLARLPSDLDGRHLLGIGLLGGIGFTMSIFIADLGFAQHPQELLMAKTGILIASMISGLCGVAWLWFRGSVQSNQHGYQGRINEQ